MIFGIVNCLWIVIVMMLSRSIDFRIVGIDLFSKLINKRIKFCIIGNEKLIEINWRVYLM